MKKNEMRKVGRITRKQGMALLLASTMGAAALSGCGEKMDTTSKQSTSDEYVAYETTSNSSKKTSNIVTEEYPVDEFQIKSSINGASAEDCTEPAGYYSEYEIDFNTEEYKAIVEKGFSSPLSDPFSTFSADVDTASYSNLRRMIEDNYEITDIPEGAVRIEEMVNYFKYDYNLPKGKEPFGVTTVMGDCPWNENAKLLQIGLKTQDIDFSEASPSNLVFLLDVSGSMDEPNKLPLLQRAFGMLVDELGEKDRISIVTYAGNDEIVLEGAKGSDKTEIKEAIDDLMAGGCTNGSDGIETAYELAEKYFIKGGNNRVILATDGDLNVGTTSESELEKLISKKKKSGVFLSVLGFGTGNIKDNKMETLADKGNGNYAYIDSVTEAKKVMVEEMGSNFVTVAKDVKFQLDFNPYYIKGYRLIGYENRMLDTQDFTDDTKDAGEIGAGHTVTALYEIIPSDSEQEISTSNSKYQETENKGVDNGEWMTLKIRYKNPDEEKSKELEYVIAEDVYTQNPNADFYFASAVTEFGMLIRDSEYKGDSSFENIYALLEKSDITKDDYREEFKHLVKKLDV